MAPLVIAIVLFDGMTALDAVGPFEVLGKLPGFTVKLVSDTAGATVRTSSSNNPGMDLGTTHAFQDVPRPDVIVVPGGLFHMLPLKHKPLIDWIRQVHQTSLYTTSVCTGSLLLGEAGILCGLEATTHWAFYEQLASYGAKPTSRKYVQQGKIITAAGVSSGIDFALYLASLLADDLTAKAIQLRIEYDPQPPFSCGSLDKAGPEVVAKAKQMLSVL